MDVDTEKWSGEGTFTQTLIDRIKTVEGIALVRVEDAPATRSGADYNFLSNEIFVVFDGKQMSVAGLETRLAADAEIGTPDYSDEGMLQYLRTERVIPPYQTKGYKLVELVRVYDAGKPRK